MHQIKEWVIDWLHPFVQGAFLAFGAVFIVLLVYLVAKSWEDRSTETHTAKTERFLLTAGLISILIIIFFYYMGWYADD